MPSSFTTSAFRALLSGLVSVALAFSIVPTALAAPADDEPSTGSDPAVTEQTADRSQPAGPADADGEGDGGGTAEPTSPPTPAQPPSPDTGEQEPVETEDATQEPATDPKPAEGQTAEGADDPSEGIPEFVANSPLADDPGAPMLRSMTLGAGATQIPEMLLPVLTDTDLGTNGRYDAQGSDGYIRTSSWARPACTASAAEGANLRITTICEKGWISSVLIDPVTRQAKDSKRVPLTGTLPILGTVAQPTANAIYVVSGQANPNELNGVDVVRIQRFTTSLEAAGTQTMKSEVAPGLPGIGIGRGILSPFDGAAPSVTVSGGNVYVHMGRKMFTGNDGQNHQGSVTVKAPWDLSGPITSHLLNYYSHSWKQLAADAGGTPVFVDHSDGGPYRIIGLGIPRNVTDDRPFAESETMILPLADLDPSLWNDNTTGATLSEMAVIGGSTFGVVGRSAPQRGTISGITGMNTKNKAEQTVSNVYLSIATASSEAAVYPEEPRDAKRIWLTTNHPTDSTTIVSEPSITAVNLSQFVVLFSVEDTVKKTKSLEYRLVDTSGTVVWSASFPGVVFLPSAPPRLAGNILTWVGDAATSPRGDSRLYAINVANPKAPAIQKLATPPYDNAPTPTVAGTTKVGQTLTATVGTWSPTPGNQAFQWKRNGTAIGGATGTSYTLVPADLNATITFEVTATGGGRQTTVRTSAPTASVTAGSFTQTPKPTIGGLPAVSGRTLTAQEGTWRPAAAFTYTWYRDGAEIPNSNSRDYTVGPADAGKALSVKVTGSASGYVTMGGAQTTSLPTSKVPAETLTPTPVPKISGTAAVGQTLTAEPGTWGPAPVKLSFQWKAGSNAISGATGTTYKVSPDDAGKAITVEVTGSKDGYASVTKASQPTPAVARAQFQTVGTPSLPTVAYEGQRLTVDHGTWDPQPTLFGHTWKRDGVEFNRGGNYDYYDLTAQDTGHVITVTVTAWKLGYDYAPERTSNGTRVGGEGLLDLRNLSAPTTPFTPMVNEPFTAYNGSWSPTPDRFEYQWMIDGGAIHNATQQTYTPHPNYAGRQLSVRVTAVKAGFKSVSFVATPRDPVATGRWSLPFPTVTVTGTPQDGAVLSASVSGTWNPTPDSTHFQWYRGDAEIPGATSETYTLTAEDVGRTVYVRQHASRKGYSSVSMPSAATALVQPAPSGGQPGNPKVKRLWGDSRFATAADISRSAFPNGADRVVLVNGYSFADSLSAAPLAAKQHAPVLMVNAGNMPEVTRAEIRRLKPKYITVVGGDGVVGNGVFSEAKALASGSPAGHWRFSGNNRYETNRDVVSGIWGGPGARVAFFATGQNFPDALGAGAAAAKVGAPLLLVPPTADHPSLSRRDNISDLKVETAYIAGGPGVVSSAVVKVLAPDAGLDPMFGDNRYETSAAIAKRFNTPGGAVFLADGSGFADALAGAVIAGLRGGPVLLSAQTCISRPAQDAIGLINPSDITLFGGRGVLTDSVFNLGVCP